MKVWIVTDKNGTEWEVFEHTHKKPLECMCGKKINKGDIYTESDAGDIYCEECSTE